MILSYDLRWYFGAINRRKAVDLLQAENNVAGSFLVRDSDQVWTNKNNLLLLMSWHIKDE